MALTTSWVNPGLLSVVAIAVVKSLLLAVAVRGVRIPALPVWEMTREKEDENLMVICWAVFSEAIVRHPTQSLGLLPCIQNFLVNTALGKLNSGARAMSTG